jgi:hypothetical protein
VTAAVVPIGQREAPYGTCLGLSGKIYREQAYRESLVDGRNVVLAPDPKDRPALADRLRPLIDSAVAP